MKRIIISALAVVLAIALTAGAAQGAFAEGAAPVAENLELKTYRNTSVGGCLSAYDPDGGAVSYEITTKPVKGQLRYSERGLFVYTPDQDRRGRDYFGYKAIDVDGNYSQEATVIIKIEKQKGSVCYSDMIGEPENYAAVELSERGIFTGEQLCGRWCFCPERELTRAEFLAMCMSAAGKSFYTGVQSTGFSDDRDIDAWMKGCVVAAAMDGVNIGVGVDKKEFAPDTAISVAEAALMLDSALKLTPVAYLADDFSAVGEAAQACANLSACGVLSADTQTENTLTRGEAAEMLINALRVLEKR